MEQSSPEFFLHESAPGSVGSMSHFKQLLSQLWSAYEEVCARNLMFERHAHVERGCGVGAVECKPEVEIHGSANGLVDPWCPIQFPVPSESSSRSIQFLAPHPISQHRGQQHLQVASKQFQVAAVHTTTQLKQCANAKDNAEFADSIAQQVVRQLHSCGIQVSPESVSSGTKFVPYLKAAQDACNEDGSVVVDEAQEIVGDEQHASIDQSTCVSELGRGKPSSGKSSSAYGSRRNSGPVISPVWSTFSRQAEERNFLAFCSRLLHKKEFELAIAVLILMNSLVMCFEAQYHGLDVGKDLEYPGRTRPAADVWLGAKSAFNVLDWIFGLAFAVEMVVKLACWHHRYFFDFRGLDLGLGMRKYLHGVRGWNWLDCLCVVGFCADKAVTNLAINPQILRVLRLLRLWRLVRLLRFLETVDQLYVMTTAIASLGKVLTWAVLLLTTMLLTCDLCLVQVLQATYFNNIVASDLTDDQLRKHRQVYEYFGTCTRGILSMYEITMGNWPPIARLLSEEVSEWFTLICLIHKLTIGFAVIGVITGVILQETFKVAQTDDLIMFRQKQLASKVLREKMTKLFDALDESGNGHLAFAEFNNIGDLPEIKTWLSSLDIETDDLDTLFDLIDVEGKRYVTLDDLVARIPHIKGPARSIDVLRMRKHLNL